MSHLLVEIWTLDHSVGRFLSVLAMGRSQLWSPIWTEMANQTWQSPTIIAVTLRFIPDWREGRERCPRKASPIQPRFPSDPTPGIDRESTRLNASPSQNS